MKQQEVFKKIGTILKELNEQYEYLGEADAQQNDLELELFAANTHFLAEHSAVLRKLNQQNALTHDVKEEPIKKQEEKYFEPVVQQITPVPEIKLTPEVPIEPLIELNHGTDEPVPQIDLAANGADDDFSATRREPGVIKHELVLDESLNWEDEDDPGFEIDETAGDEEDTPPIPVTAEPEPVNTIPPVEAKKEIPPPAIHKTAPAQQSKKEIPAEEPLTINQVISAQLNKAGNRVSEQLHAQPISDLKQAINLNDKLLYIKDLFNGYNLAYSEAIDILNRFSTFTEADDFLRSNYAAKNHWTNSPATVDKFYELLKRRFA